MKEYRNSERARIGLMSLDEIKTEILPLLKGKRSGWRWVGDCRNVAALPDGTIESNGYDEKRVAGLILLELVVEARKRSLAAKKAAETRAIRRERMAYKIAQKILSGAGVTPSDNCHLCGKAVSDDESRQRGIGPDCWQFILRLVEGDTNEKAQGATNTPGQMTSTQA